MPATNLYEEAASQAAQARLSQDTRAGQLMNLAKDYLAKGDEVEANRAADLAKLAASRPSLYAQALQNAQAGSRQDMATVISALALQNTQDKTAADIVAGKAKTAQGAKATTASVAKAGAQTKKAGAETTKTTAATTGLLPNGQLAPGFAWSSSDPKTRVPQPYDTDKYMLDPADPTHTKVIARPAPPSTAKGTSPATIAKNRQKAIGQAIKDVTTAAKSATFTRNATPPLMRGIQKDRWVPTMSYAKAKQKMLDAYVPKALRKNQRILTGIDNALAAWGYKVP